MKIALAHGGMGCGGSEVAVFWGVAALRGYHDLNLITGCPIELDRLNRHCGTDISPADFHPLVAPQWPRKLIGHTDALRGAVFGRFLRSAASQFDVCLSGYNIMDFGKPAIQFIADFSFDDELRRSYDPAPPGLRGWGHRPGTFRRAYLGLARMIAGHSGYDGRDDLIVANSNWTADVLRLRRGMRIDRVINPPVVADAPYVPWEQREGGFTILGRISHEKRIERVIDILARVRAKGHDVHLHVIGPIDNDAYGAMISRRIADNAAWCFAEGRKAGAEKMQVLASHRYAIHGRASEAFGIAVAEQVMAGCIPFVPDSGGPVEIVGHPDLCYRDVDDAVAKIDAVLRDKVQQAALCESLTRQGQLFSTDRFMRELRAVVEEFIERRGIRAKA